MTESAEMRRLLTRARGLMASIVAMSVVGVAVVQVRPIWIAMLAAYVVVESITLLRLRAVFASLDRQDGDLMFRSGGRVDSEALMALLAAERLEGPLCYAAMALAVLSVLHTGVLGLLVALALFVPAFMVHATNRERRGSMLLNDAIHALFAGDLDLAERMLKRIPSQGAAIREASANMEAEILARRGHLEEARERIESSWSGTLDASAVGVATLRLEHGDPALAESLLAAPDPPNSFERYARTRVRTHVDLVSGRYADVIAATDDLSEWPPNLAELLLVYRWAAQRASGATSGIPDDRRDDIVRRYGWWESWFPAAWALLVGGEVPESQPLPPAPRVQIREASPDKHHHGFLPVEWLPASPRRGRAQSGIRIVMLPILLLLGLVLGVLLIIVRLGGMGLHGPLAVGPGIAVLAMGVSLADLARLGVVRWTRGGERSAVMTDGTRVNLEHLRLYIFADRLPMLVAAITLGAVFPAIEYLMFQSVRSVLIGTPLFLLFLWSAARLMVAQFLVEQAHLAPPQRWLATVERIPGFLFLNEGRIGMHGLAKLWTGDGAGAREVWERGRMFSTRVAGFVGWLDAGAGEVDLDGLLRRDLPDDPGTAYRAGVGMLLGAIRHGREARVPSEVRERLREVAEGLPNRFGDLLTALLDRLADRNAALPADLAWVDAVWPGLWSGSEPPEAL